MLRLATKFAPQLPALETAFRAGFRYAELWLDQDVLANGQSAIRQARHYFQDIVLHFPNRLDLPIESLEQFVAMYRHLDSKCVVIHQPMFDRYQETLLRQEPKLQLAVENIHLSPEEFSNWAESNPGLALDVEHLWKYTLRDSPLHQLLEHLQGFLKHYTSKLHHVHLPGYWPGFDEHRPMYCAREMIFPVLTMLADAGFEGLIVSEVESKYQNSFELCMDVLLFNKWAELFNSTSIAKKQPRMVG